MLYSKAKATAFFFIVSLFVFFMPSAFAQSKYAQIKNGVGNILIGEQLPYNDDDGYENAVLDSVKLSDMAKWKDFYFRVYLAKPISDIEHDIRVLSFHIEGVGKKADQFKRDIGSNFVLTVERKDDSESYGERTEWSKHYPDFNAASSVLGGLGLNSLDNAQKMKLEEYLCDYNYADPSTFKYRRLESDIGDVIDFSPATFKAWKSKYSLTSLVIKVDAYSFVNGGEVSEGENKTTLEVNSDGDLEEKEHLASVKTYTEYNNKQHLATGKFTIVLE